MSSAAKLLARPISIHNNHKATASGTTANDVSRGVDQQLPGSVRKLDLAMAAAACGASSKDRWFEDAALAAQALLPAMAAIVLGSSSMSQSSMLPSHSRCRSAYLYVPPTCSHDALRLCSSCFMVQVSLCLLKPW